MAPSNSRHTDYTAGVAIGCRRTSAPQSLPLTRQPNVFAGIIKRLCPDSWHGLQFACPSAIIADIASRRQLPRANAAYHLRETPAAALAAPVYRPGHHHPGHTAMLLRRNNINCTQDDTPGDGHADADVDFERGSRCALVYRRSHPLDHAEPHPDSGHALPHTHQYSDAHTAPERDAHPHSQPHAGTQGYAATHRHAAPAQRHARTEPDQLTRPTRG
jgi:hypothetical protein